MDLFLQLTLAGLAIGSIYSCVALAVVMIYQATDHFNFAQGEMAMFSTYVAWTLVGLGAPVWLAFLLAVGISFLAGVIIERVIVKPVENAPVLNQIIVFIGLLVIFNAVAGWIWEFTIKPFPSLFPEDLGFKSTLIGPHHIGVIALTLGVLALVFAFFRFTRVGLAMRAAAANPDSARLVGISVGWMLALGWGLAASIGAVGGILVAPIVYLEPNMNGRRAALRLRRRAAGWRVEPGRRRAGRARRGRARELGRAIRSGRFRAETHLRADPHRGRAGFQAGRAVRPRRGTKGLTAVDRPNPLRPGLIVGFGAAIVFAAVVPHLVSDFTSFQFTQAMAYGIALLGLKILTGYNGQFSIGHSAFYAVGAYTAAILLYHFEWNHYATLPVAALAAFIVGFLFACPRSGWRGSILRSRPSPSPWQRRSCSNSTPSSTGPAACRGCSCRSPSP